MRYFPTTLGREGVYYLDVMAIPARKVLIFRLSSLGDVILASSVLNPALTPDSVDWVVASEFAEVLQGHPRIRRLWHYDRRKDSSFGAWRKLCSELIAQDYDEVIDLHGSLRTRAAKVLFWLSSRRFPIWRTISKQRLRLWGFFLFKGLWPNTWRPETYLARFARTAHPGSRAQGTNLSHLVRVDRTAELRKALKLEGQPYYGLMPSSRWNGKKWSWEKYLEVAKGISVTPVILGTATDVESVRLAGAMRDAGLKFAFPAETGVARGLGDLASLIAGAEFYLGNDTGLSHLSEALGRPAYVIFGPTSPHMGFGPWRAASRSLQSPVFCNPCGKDGRRCARFWSPYRCMTSLTPKDVFDGLRQASRDLSFGNSLIGSTKLNQEEQDD